VISLALAIVTPDIDVDSRATARQTSTTCEQLSGAAVGVLADALTVNGRATVDATAAVESGSPSNAYYVAARLSGPGLDDPVGIWAMDNIRTPGAVFSVDDIANEFSEWDDGRTTEAAFSPSDPAARSAIACIS